MAKVLYTAHAYVTGGRDGHGRTDDGELEVNLRIPKEMGGAGGGTDPEELFAVGYAACFESAIGGVARRRHIKPVSDDRLRGESASDGRRRFQARGDSRRDAAVGRRPGAAQAGAWSALGVPYSTPLAGTSTWSCDDSQTRLIAWANARFRT